MSNCDILKIIKSLDPSKRTKFTIDDIINDDCDKDEVTKLLKYYIKIGIISKDTSEDSFYVKNMCMLSQF